MFSLNEGDSENVKTVQMEMAPEMGEFKRMYAAMVELHPKKLDADQAKVAWLKDEAHTMCNAQEEEAGYVGQHGGSNGAS